MATSNWTTVRLGAVCTKVGSGATPRGGSEVYLDDGPYALIRSQNVHDDGFHRQGLAYIGEKHAADLANVEVEEGDVLLNITGDSVARCCMVDDSVLPARVNQHVAIIRPNPEQLDASFLRYALISPKMKAMMLSWAGAGGTRNALTKGMIEAFRIAAPLDVAEQQAIAHILGTLDDKIDLNRRISATLEAIARALFRSWFVDFDPARTKAGGHQMLLPPQLATLYPESWDASELGDIPAGWHIAGLDEIARFVNGLALQRFPATDGRSLPVIKIAQLRSGHTAGADTASADLPSDYIVNDGDVLFSWSGTLECVLWAGGRGALNQHLFRVASLDYPKWFYFMWIRHHLTDFRHIAAGKATTMGHIQRHHLSEAKVVVPPRPVIQAADSFVAPLVDRSIQCRVESRVLAALRDTLLPRLISGELHVPDAERLVGQAL